MTNNGIARLRTLSVVWPAVFVGMAGAVGLWMWLARAHRGQVVLAAAALALTVLVGVVGQLRVRAARWQAILDHFAEREIARSQRRNALPSLHASSAH